MIVTVTPNPSIDRTLAIPALRRGEVIRATWATAEAGGKGINVARNLVTMGTAAMALAPASRSGGAALIGLLDGAVELRPIPIREDVRVNVSVVEPDGTTTKLNEPGPRLTVDDAARLLDALAEEIASIDDVAWVVASGSLPPGVPDDFHARLASRVPTFTRVAIDADRGALRAAADSPAALLKPNRAELEELVGASLPTLGTVVAAARQLVDRGIGQVLVSLGSDGAVAVGPDGACHAEAAFHDLANTVGAGDALLAGYLAGGATRGALPEAIAWSVAACRAAGTRMPPVTERDRAAVVVHPELDRDRVLHG